MLMLSRASQGRDSVSRVSSVEADDWAHYKYCGYCSVLRSAGITVAINFKLMMIIPAKRDKMTKVKISFVSIFPCLTGKISS